MVKKVFSFWERLLLRIDNWAERRHRSWSDDIAADNKVDELEIERARRAILNHQYLLHMAECQIQARNQWLEMLKARSIQETRIYSLPTQTLGLVSSQGSYANHGAIGTQ